MPSHKKKKNITRSIPSDKKLSRLFSNSTWIVPHNTLLAYRTINNINTEVQDQTVWLIDKYNDGYITGTSYTTLDGQPSSKNNMIGSITPYGNVLFAFYNNEGSKTDGFGEFIKRDGKWQFIMQVSSLNSFEGNTINLTHWSYMVEISKNDKEYCHLPGVDISVKQFISLFDDR